jgi:hypothetical protein
MIDIFQIFATHGVWIGVSTVLATFLGAYVRRDWKRLDTLEKRVSRLEEELRESYASVIVPCQEVLAMTNKLLEKFLLRD